MPDYRYRVRQSNDFWVKVKADSYEDGLDFLHKQLELADEPEKQVKLHFVEGRWETDGGDSLPDSPRHAVDLHQSELEDTEFDTESSASRQNWIETGLYLTHSEVAEFNTAARLILNDHEAKPCDHAAPCNCCKVCGVEVSWLGGSIGNEWEHAL